MKKFIYSLSVVLSMLTFSSCSDFFSPDTDDELNGEDYISSDTEMYTGFLGIMTRLQNIGDKEILLTETRGELVEITEQSTPELIALYNYDDDLTGNSYANPAGYYEVIIACNDYLTKMLDYRHQAGVKDDVWQDLVSSTLRIKVWAYKTLGEIYGEAVWFDDPITKLTDITAENGFVHMNISELVTKCIQVLDEGFDGVSSRRNIDWIAWLDPSNITNIAGSEYRKWNWMVPPIEGLYAELCLWKGAAIDALNPGATTANPEAVTYYKKAADEMLEILTWYADLKYKADQTDPGSTVYWLPSAASPGKYTGYFNAAQPLQSEVVAALIYDYTKNQTNTLLHHFSAEYPNEYLLRPSTAGIERFLDTSFNPGASEAESRYKCTFGRDGGRPYIAKFRPVGSSIRPNAYQDDCHIYLYRATQYHLMLAEALNHLKRFVAMNGVFNNGVTKDVYQDGLPEWEGFSRNWTSDAEWGTRRYPSMGIHCCYGGTARKTITSLVGYTEAEVYKHNDLEILNEGLLEFACEGKAYPMMNRMALRYGDLNIIADRVCPKYEAAGLDGAIRGKILSGGNWVKYDLHLLDAPQK